MKLSMFDVANEFGTLVSEFHCVCIPDDEYATPMYLFNDTERANIIHNWLVGELRSERDDYGNLFFIVPAWALTAKATHAKEERTPAEHLNAIMGMLGLLGFETISGGPVAITEEDAADYAARAHADINNWADTLEKDPFAAPYADSVRHTGHDRRFCDAVVRAIISGNFHDFHGDNYITAPKEEYAEFLNAAMKFVTAYHNSWGF